MVEYYNEITSENGSSVIINGWKAAGIYNAIKAGSSGLQSINPIEYISPLVTKRDESESFLPATINQLTDELRENFVNVPFDEENSEWEQSDNEDDVDSERNISDNIINDDEWIDNPDSTLYLTFVYQTYDTYIPVVFVSVFSYFAFQVRRFGTVLVLNFLFVRNSL